jgi:hypothetical protein
MSPWLSKSRCARDHVLADAFRAHCGAQERMRPRTSLVGPHIHESLLRQRLSGDPQSREYTSDDHGRRTLNVVVVARQAPPIPREQIESMTLVEVLPLEDRMREYLLDASNEGLEECIVGRPA